MEKKGFFSDRQNAKNLSMAVAVLAIAAAFAYGWSPDFGNMFLFLVVSVFVIIAEWFVVLPGIDFVYLEKGRGKAK